MPRVEVHSRSTQALVEILENAYAVGWEKRINASSIAWFSLPRDDPKWSSIQPLEEIWLYDDLDQLVDVFRISPIQERRDRDGTTARVELDSIVTVLQDDFIYDEVIYAGASGGSGQIMTALLNLQTVMRIQPTVGGSPNSGVDVQLTTGTETFRAANISVMRAIWELRNMIGGYISLEYGATPASRALWIRYDPGDDIGQRVLTGLNLRELAKTTHSQSIVTKVWPLGRGEGRAQVRPSTDKLMGEPITFLNRGAGLSSLITITDPYSRYKGWLGLANPLPNGVDAKDTRARPMTIWRGAINETANFLQGTSDRTLESIVNNYNPGAGTWTLDYVHADFLMADTEVALYGTIGTSLVDKNLEASVPLILAARDYIAVAKSPRSTYEIKAVDLARIFSTETFERLKLYDKVLVQDAELAVATKDRIVMARYGNMDDPETFELAISNLPFLPPQSGMGMKAYDVANRVRQYEGTPDGAVVMMGPISYDENMTGAQPYVANIVIPEDVIRVIKVTVTFRTDAYRWAGAGGITVGATTTAVTMTVDGNVASAGTLTRDDYDISPYLTKDANGDITKGLHLAVFTPTGGTLEGRIQATFRGLVYVHSRGVVRG